MVVYERDPTNCYEFIEDKIALDYYFSSGLIHQNHFIFSTRGSLPNARNACICAKSAFQKPEYNL